MSDIWGIPVVSEPARPRSGEKYLTPQGFTAVRDGIKSARGAGGAVQPRAPGLPVTSRLPPWLRSRAPTGEGFRQVRALVREHRLATVCEEAHCPNIGECWNPRTVELMKLRYVVLTSVDRDDLPDGGAAHYAACVRAIKRRNPATAVEALTPDFQGSTAAVETVIDSGVEVFAQNIETVRRLTHPVRDPRAGYAQTLAVLAHAKRHRPAVITKSSLMLGLGESDAEIEATLDDLRTAGVELVTLGQYLRPTVNHLPVERFVTPAEFDLYRERALAGGFHEWVSGPLVRSSYRAEQALNRNNAGLDNSRLVR